MDSERKIVISFSISGRQDEPERDVRLTFPAEKDGFKQVLEMAGAGWTDKIQMKYTFYENETASPIDWMPELAFNETCVNELNYLAARLSELDDDAFAKFEAVIESGRHCGTAGGGIGELADYINIIDNLDSFTYHLGFGELEYGEYLLTGPNNKAAEVISLLRNYYGQEGEELADYVECLRESADEEQFGRSMAANVDGEFLSNGYLIEEDVFYSNYSGLDDIPDKYRIWETPDAFIKAVDIELSMFLLEMHALGGNYTQEAGHNFQTLINGGDFFITESKGKLTVIPADEVFCKDSVYNADFPLANEQDARAFFVTVKEIDEDEYWGNIHEIDYATLQGEVARLSYEAVNIDAEFRDGATRLISPAEWRDLSSSEREQAIDIVYRYDPADEQKAAEFLSGLREAVEKSGRTVTKEDFLVDFNMPFTAKAQNQQPGMLRIAREAAKEMLARGDAEIYRLMPEGAVKLTPIDTVKSGGLRFKEHREFAIKLGGMSGLRKWARRTGEDITRQAGRGELKKSRDAEL